MALINRHRLWQLGVDATLIAGVWYLAFVLRFDHGPGPIYSRYWRDTIALVVMVKLLVFLVSGLYNKWWRYISLRDLQVIARAVVIATVLLDVFFFFARIDGRRLPIGIAVMDPILTLVAIAGVRVLTRSLIERPRPGAIVPSGKEVLIVGAGDAGGLVLREMLSSRMSGYTPIGLIDDDPRKRHMRLHGVRVIGTTSELRDLLRAGNRPDEVHIAIPSAGGAARSRIVAACRDASVPVKTLPSVHDLVEGDSDLVRQLREVRVEDVLGREPVQLDVNEIGAYAAGRVVLVTGAGGSIGSELCRQLSRMRPERLVLLDHAENNLFTIERELVDRGFTDLVPIIGDVKDRAKLDQVFAAHKPSVVFHAAAYKHVAMMQANPLEAVRNNALATRTLARVAAAHGAERFVLVSTDKAVNARGVMGASKALAEWIVEAMAQENPTTVFVGVRFGNVLGSSGSIVPIFRDQIARGGPVTVTHPDMTRYFMTIPEAAQLIVQAGGVGVSGEIFLLDMGDPVRIMDLAQDMIRLSGHEPGRDIQIAVIGMRSGEKLHEELVEAGEVVTPTHHEKLRRVTRATIDAGWLEDELDALEVELGAADTPGVVTHLDAMMRRPQREPTLVARDG